MRSIGQRCEAELMDARGKHERMRARFAEREAERERERRREEEERRRREEAEQQHAAYVASMQQQQQQQALQQQAGYGASQPYTPQASAYSYNSIADAAAAAAGGGSGGGGFMSGSYSLSPGMPAGGSGFQQQQYALPGYSQGSAGGGPSVSGFSSAPLPQPSYNHAPQHGFPSAAPAAQPYLLSAGHSTTDARYGHYGQAPVQQVEQQLYPHPAPPATYPHARPPFAGGPAPPSAGHGQGGMNAMYAGHGW